MVRVRVQSYRPTLGFRVGVRVNGKI